MFGVDDRRPPASVPLGLSLRDPIAVLIEERPVRFVPVGALPPRGLKEDGAELALAGVEGTQLHVAIREPLLGGVDDAVDLVIAFRGARVDVRPGALMIVEPADVRAVRIDIGDSARHPLGHRLRNARSLLDPDGGRGPHAAHLGALAEDGKAVRRQRQEAVDGPSDPDRLIGEDVGHQLERPLHLRGEVLLGERELRRRRRLFERRDVVGVHEDRAVRVRADLQLGSTLALVHVRVHVPNDRVRDLARRIHEERHRSDVDHLVHGGGQRDGGAGHPGDARAPHPTADRHHVGPDHPSVGPHAAHAALLDVDAEHLCAREHEEGAPLLGVLAHQGTRADRVHNTHPRAVEASQEDLVVDERDSVFDLSRREQLRLFTPGLRGHQAPLEFLETLWRAGHLDPPALDEHAQGTILAHALLSNERHFLGVVDWEDEVRSMAGGPAGVRHRALVEEHDLSPALKREMIGQDVSDDARPDDHHASTVWQHRGPISLLGCGDANARAGILVTLDDPSE